MGTLASIAAPSAVASSIAAHGLLQNLQVRVGENGKFEVVAGGRILRVDGARLKKWIENRRYEWKGPRGMLFSQRPMIGD